MARTTVYRGVSARDRRAARREQLLAAGLEMMSTEGWSATSVRGVCQRAGLTPRFFYESFDDLDALAVAVLDEILDRVFARGVETLADAPDDPRARVQAAIETMVGELIDDPRRARVVFIEALGSEPLMKRRLSALREIAALIAGQARATYDFPPGSDRFVELTSIVLAGGVTELVIVWLDGGLDVTRDELIAATVELVARVSADAGRMATGVGAGTG